MNYTFDENFKENMLNNDFVMIVENEDSFRVMRIEKIDNDNVYGCSQEIYNITDIRSNLSQQTHNSKCEFYKDHLK